MPEQDDIRETEPEATVAVFDGNVWQILGLQGGQGVSDHGLLTGLGDDDHPHYHNNTRGDARYARIVHNHDASYLSPSEVLAGTNITIDRVTTPNSVIINGHLVEEVQVAGGFPADPNVELWVDTSITPEVVELKEDKHYVFVQATLSDTWVIPHGLGKCPAVSITDSAGSQIYGSIHHDSENQVVITFSTTVTGFAYCN